MQHAFNTYGLGPGQGLGQILGGGQPHLLQQWNMHPHQSKYCLTKHFHIIFHPIQRLSINRNIKLNHSTLLTEFYYQVNLLNIYIYYYLHVASLIIILLLCASMLE